MKLITKLSLLNLMLVGSMGAYAKTQYACVDSDTLNIRQSSSTQSEVLWEVVRDYPFEILASKGLWRKVKDFEGDIGWVYSRYLRDGSCIIVKNKIANVRSSASINSKKIGQADYGDVFVVTKISGDWVQIQWDAKTQGWINAPLVWGAN